MRDSGSLEWGTFDSDGLRRLSRRHFLIQGGRLSLVALASPSILVACADGGGQAEQQTAKIIGFDFPFNEIPVYNDLVKFAKERAEQHGYELLLTADEGDLERQINNVRTWVTREVPAMTIYPLENATMEEIAAEAREKGLIWITYASHMENEDGAVLFSNLESGRLMGEDAARWVNENLGGKAKVLYLTFEEVSVGRERAEGMREAFEAGAPEAEIVAEQKSNAQDTGLQVTESVLEANPDLNVVLGINDDGALGAYQAFLNRGTDPKDPGIYVGGQDGTEQALETVKENVIYRATIGVRLRDIGYAIVDLPRRVLEGGPGGEINIEPVVIHHDSPELEEYLSDYKE